MHRVQYVFEAESPQDLQPLRDAALEAARLALAKGLPAPTIWVSEDEGRDRLVVEFSGADKWDAHEQGKVANADPDIAPILGRAFKGRLTDLQVYASVTP